MSDDATLPLPEPTPQSAPFWAAARASRLVIPFCNSCGSTWFPPSCACPSCGSESHSWKAATGRGTVFSFVVMHRAFHPAFRDKIPYVVAVIALEEGPRLMTNIVGVAPDQVRCDMPVRVIFEERLGGVKVPQFTPAAP